MDLFDRADFIIRHAAYGVPRLMLCDADGIFVGVLQVGLVGFVNIGGEALFLFASLLAQFMAVCWRHI